MRVLLLLALLALPAHAAEPKAERPLTMPARDVDITYRIAGPDGALTQRLRWGVALGKLRVDPPSPGLYVVLDTRTHQIQTVREGEKSVFQMQAGPGATPGTPPLGRYARRDAITVAGLACTNWETTDSDGALTLACLTEDGVLLQAQSAGVVFVRAISVDYAEQPEAAFDVPADYKRIVAPESRR